MSLTWPPTSWPSFIVGLVLLVYWLRVLQMVIKQRLSTGRAANFVPPEPLGRVLRLIWAPTVVLWIAVPLLTPLFTGLPRFVRPCPAYFNALLGWTGCGIALAAFAATWVCWEKMGKSWRMGIDPNEKTQLIFTGPYAYVRHPIYALSSVLAVTAMLACPSALMLVVGVMHLLFLQWEARREERFLIKIHGPAYEKYRAQSGRFIPRLGARNVSA